MSSLKLQRLLSAAIFLVTPAISIFLLGLYAWRSPNSRFLFPLPSASWIIYPTPGRDRAFPATIPQHAFFRRQFELAENPHSGQVRIRSFQRSSITLNGLPVLIAAAQYPNQVRTADVAKQLRAGPNELVAEVVNDTGPPALWLVLRCPGASVATDEHWKVSQDGATEMAAQSAAQPRLLRPGISTRLGKNALDGFRSAISPLLVFAFLSGGALYFLSLIARTPSKMRLFGHELSPLGMGLLGVNLLWSILFIHDTFFVPLYGMGTGTEGFDASWHLKYIDEIQRHRHLPLADEGWKIYQPPLYYMLSAAILSICRLSTSNPSALAILRLFGLAAGLSTLASIAASLRLLFPENPRRQFAGFILASFLPVHIYAGFYVSNEMLLITLVTVSMYVALRILADPQAGISSYAILGLLLGGALLTKITALVPAGAVLLVFAGRLIIQKKRSWWVMLRTLGAVLAAMFLVTGWYYARVWSHFGTPSVGNFDAASGYRWWRDPGIGSLSFLTGFGQSLVKPFTIFSSLNGIPDALYSTAFGDGLCGGYPWLMRPPWNYSLMAAGYWLALVPSVAIIVGMIWMLVQVVRVPRSPWFLFLGVIGGLACATVYHILRYPYAGNVKASFELSCLLPLSALGAVGIDFMAGRYGRLRAYLIGILLGTWACTAYASFWILPQGPDTLTWEGLQIHDRITKAEECFRRALRIDPHHVSARFNLARIMVSSGRVAQGHQLIDDILNDDPDDVAAHWELAIILQREGKLNEAAACLRHARALAPDDYLVSSLLGGWYLSQNQLSDSIAAYRESLRIDPFLGPADHANLGLALARIGRIEESIACYRQALRLCLDQPQPMWQAHLAWILAVQGQGKYGAAGEPVLLAQRACQETEDSDPACLQVLAAVDASIGQYQKAIDAARHAARLADLGRQTDLLQEVEREVHQYVKRQRLKPSAPPQRLPYAAVRSPPILRTTD